MLEETKCFVFEKIMGIRLKICYGRVNPHIQNFKDICMFWALEVVHLQTKGNQVNLGKYGKRAGGEQDKG